MDALETYLKVIQEKEDLHGKLEIEKTREILLKYFNHYKFVDVEQATNFFYIFDATKFPYGKDPIGNPKLKLCAEEGLSDLYNIDATIEDLCLTIRDRGKYTYSWNKDDGWHEGYDPFIGDVNKCYGDTLEEAIKGLYVRDTKRNYPYELTYKMGLITEGTGYGKTNFIENSFIEEINQRWWEWKELDTLEYNRFSKKDILFITTRRSILDQQKASGKVVDAYDEDFTKNGLNPVFDDRGDKVRIITTSKLGSLFADGKIEKMFPIVVIDEIHSLYLDTMFAEQSYWCIECINYFWNDTIKVGLTATPELLFGYINEGKDLFYALDDNDLLSKYNAGEFLYCNYTYLDSIVDKMSPATDNKVVVYCSAAKKAIGLAEKYNGVFLISKYNKNIEAVEKQQPIYDYIIENQKLPDDINIIFMTSAYREGVEIKDPAVKYILIDASDEITISQFLGRVRNDVEKVIINTNEKQLERITKIADDYMSLIKGSPDLEKCYLAQQKEMEENGSATLLVQKIGDEYRINEFVKPIQSYLLDCYYQANNKLGNQIVKYGKRELKDSESWFYSFLKDYSISPIKRIGGKDELNKEFANWDCVYERLGKRLYAEDKEKLQLELGLYDYKHNRLLKQARVKQELRDRGFIVNEKRDTHDRRYWLITLAE